MNWRQEDPVRACFTGTFDPVHRGHLHAAQTVRGLLGLRSLSLIPTPYPGHRAEPVASLEQRRAMLQLAVQAHPGLTVCDTAFPGRPSTTFDMLSALRANDPRPVVWLMGSDGLATFETWHRHEELPAMCHLVAMHRPGTGERRGLKGFREARRPSELLRREAGCLLHCEEPMVDLSATRVREALAAGRPVVDMVGAAVAGYIEAHRLYR